jgi:hypothetical protein
MMGDMLTLTANYTNHRRRPLQGLEVHANGHDSIDAETANSEPSSLSASATNLRHRLLADTASKIIFGKPHLPETGPRASFLTPVSDMPPPLQSTRFLLYAGHDATLVPLLVLLGVYNGEITLFDAYPRTKSMLLVWLTDQWPDYSANLCIEIATVANSPHIQSQQVSSYASHSLNGSVALKAIKSLVRQRGRSHRIMIRLVYNGNELIIPKCEVVWCPFSTFLELLRPYSMTAEEYRSTCHNEKIK